MTRFASSYIWEMPAAPKKLGGVLPIAVASEPGHGRTDDPRHRGCVQAGIVAAAPEDGDASTRLVALRCGPCGVQIPVVGTHPARGDTRGDIEGAGRSVDPVAGRFVLARHFLQQ